jgi:hypothetical protein
MRSFTFHYSTCPFQPCLYNFTTPPYSQHSVTFMISIFFTVQYATLYTYFHVLECDYMRVLDWWPHLLDPLIQRVSTFCISLLYTLVLPVTSSLPLLCSGFQRRMFPFLWVPELSPASATSFSQQQLITNEPQQFFNCKSYLFPLITSRLGRRRKHRSSVVMQLLLSDGMAYFVVACAAISTDYSEKAIHLLLFTNRCLVLACWCDSTVLAFSGYVTVCYRLRFEYFTFRDNEVYVYIRKQTERTGRFFNTE